GSAATVSITSGAAPPPARSTPVAGRALLAATVHLYAPAGVPPDSHVQSTSAPVPVPRATSTPVELVIATLHGSACESLARTRIAVPRASALGSKILGPPSARADAAIAPSRE